MMLSCSTLEAMKIYGDLVTCYFGKNHYGGRVAEIYSYRLEKYTPSVHQIKDMIGNKRVAREVAAEAALSLAEIIIQFRDVFICAVIVEDIPFYDWLKKIKNGEGLMNRYHVEVVEIE